MIYELNDVDEIMDSIWLHSCVEFIVKWFFHVQNGVNVCTQIHILWYLRKYIAGVKIIPLLIDKPFFIRAQNYDFQIYLWTHSQSSRIIWNDFLKNGTFTTDN